MKKKVAIGFSSVFIIVAFIAMLTFVLSGDSTEEEQTIDFVGTWQVISYVDEKNVSLIENEFMVFDSDMVEDYREGKEQAYASSKYEFGSDSTIKFPDISREYLYKVISDDIVCFYEKADTYMILIRYPNEDRTPLKLEQSILTGRWKVTYRQMEGGIIDQELEFGNDTIADYRNGASEPASSSSYFWNESGHLIAEAWDKKMAFYPLDKNKVVLLELDTGFVWELQKME